MTDTEEFIANTARAIAAHVNDHAAPGEESEDLVYILADIFDQIGQDYLSDTDGVELAVSVLSRSVHTLKKEVYGA